MKLSEAIRAGAKLRPQTHGTYFRVDEHDELCSCALGAGMEGAGLIASMTTHEWLYDASNLLRDTFPELDKPVITGSEGSATLERVIVELNDEYHHTREEIADFLEEWGL